MHKQTALLLMVAVLLIAFTATLFSGGGTSAFPETFIETDSPEPIPLNISGEYLSDEIWQNVRNALRNDFGKLETESEQEGLIRTSWQYPATGRMTKCYRFRLIVQFREDRYSLTLLPEAEFQQKALLGIYRWWVSGEDSTFGNMYYNKLNKMIGKIP